MIGLGTMRWSFKGLSLLVLLLLKAGGLFGQNDQGTDEQKKGEAQGKTIKGYYDQKVFYYPGNGPYLETYITIDGKTLHYAKGKNGKERSKVRITSRIKKGDSIMVADKTINHGPSPEGKDQIPNLVDVNRFTLDSGIYQVVIDLEDLNADTVRTFTIRSSVKVPSFDRDSLIFSQIQLLENFEKSDERSRYTKSGYRMIPYVSGIYPEKIDRLNFYVELYNAKRVFPDSTHFAIRNYIYDLDKKKVMEDHQMIRTEQPADHLPYLRSMKIEDLPAGNYSLIVEARSPQNEVMSERSVYFQRKQPKEERKEDLLTQKVEGSFASEMDDPDSLRMYVRSLLPRADPVESDLIRDQAEVMSLKTMQQFMFGFWQSRNKKNPAREWFAYKKLVDHVNDEYGSPDQKGFETDRGRVMLQYGKPDQIVSRKNKPHSYPYEIWQYYEIGQFTNKRFVFYNPSLSGRDYELLHSDMPGELKNRRWRRDLQDRQNVMDNVDEEEPIDHFGREVDDIFRNP